MLESVFLKWLLSLLPDFEMLGLSLTNLDLLKTPIEMVYWVDYYLPVDNIIVCIGISVIFFVAMAVVRAVLDLL